MTKRAAGSGDPNPTWVGLLLHGSGQIQRTGSKLETGSVSVNPSRARHTEIRVLAAESRRARRLDASDGLVDGRR